MYRYRGGEGGGGGKRDNLTRNAVGAVCARYRGESVSEAGCGMGGRRGTISPGTLWVLSRPGMRERVRQRRGVWGGKGCGVGGGISPGMLWVPSVPGMRE